MGSSIENLLKPISPHQALEKLTIDLTDQAKNCKIDPVIGARPPRCMLEEKLVDPIAQSIIEETIKPGDTISPRVENGKLVI